MYCAFMQKLAQKQKAMHCKNGVNWLDKNIIQKTNLSLCFSKNNFCFTRFLRITCQNMFGVIMNNLR